MSKEFVDKFQQGFESITFSLLTFWRKQRELYENLVTDHKSLYKTEFKDDKKTFTYTDKE